MTFSTGQTSKSICIIGVGYVGLPLAVEFGKILDVIAYDIDEERIKLLNDGIDLTAECGPNDIKSSSRLKFTSDEKDISACDIYIVTVPTPVDDAHIPNLEPLKEASRLVGRYLSTGNIVIYESTVYPGATEEVCVPLLEQLSALTYNKEFFCGYSPERINPGDKENSLTSIVKITSGSTTDTAMEVDNLYKKIIKAGTFRVSCIKVAEAAKVIENAQRDLNIAFVNELSMIFNKLEIDTNEVLTAAGSKWNFLKFSPGFVGGHCIGVDPYYLAHKAEMVGYHPQLLLAGRRINDSMSEYASMLIIKAMLAESIDVSASTIGILGMTFKDNCPDIRNSKAINIYQELQSWGANVVAHDPCAVPIDMWKQHGIKLVGFDELVDLDAIVVAVMHNEFRDLQPSQLRKLCRGCTPILADLKTIYGIYECTRQGFRVVRL